GGLHEPRPGQPEPGDFHGPLRNTYRRTHRWGRVHRDENELAIGGHEDKLMHVLFSTAGDDMGLYGKPMARNAQLWSHDLRLILDGPNATPDDIRKAVQLMHEGGLFGYRFQFPAMRVGRHEVYWHRPLVAYRNANGEPVVLPDAPAGYLTAYDTARPRLDRPVELWPRVHDRPVMTEALKLYQPGHGQIP